jgi:hypothetical protein
MLLAPLLSAILQFSDIGEQIWQNECGKDKEKLIFWNSKEEFPSLGIGHFIWLPQSSHAPFQETFPSLIAFLKKEGVALPTWLEGTCPWETRDAFLKEKQSPKVKELQSLLEKTIPLQTQFLHLRFQTIEKQLPEQKDKINRLKASPQGLYALIDYLNFKGSGLSEKERYKGEGWGLLHVLQQMPSDGTAEEAPSQFAAAALFVLKRRVSNAPMSEEHFFSGWKKRVESYCGERCK